MTKTKVECVKLEFTSTPPNNQKFFDISSKKYGNKVNCTAKLAGKKGTNYFSSKLKFTIDADCKNPKITCIHIVDITHIGKTNDPLKVCGKYHYYYNIYCDGSDSSNSCDQVIDDEFEQTIYNALKSMLMTGKVTKYNGVIRVGLSLPVLFIDSMCMNIRVGTDKFAKGPDCNDCNDCSLSAIGGKCNNGKSNSSKSSTSCSSSSSSSQSKCHNNKKLKEILKYIAWAVIIIFIGYIIRGPSIDPLIENKSTNTSAVLSLVKNLVKSKPKPDQTNNSDDN